MNRRLIDLHGYEAPGRGEGPNSDALRWSVWFRWVGLALSTIATSLASCESQAKSHASNSTCVEGAAIRHQVGASSGIAAIVELPEQVSSSLIDGSLDLDELRLDGIIADRRDPNAVRIVAREFADDGVSIILLDSQSGSVAAKRRLCGANATSNRAAVGGCWDFEWGRQAQVVADQDGDGIDDLLLLNGNGAASERHESQVYFMILSGRDLGTISRRVWTLAGRFENVCLLPSRFDANGAAAELGGVSPLAAYPNQSHELSYLRLALDDLALVPVSDLGRPGLTEVEGDVRASLALVGAGANRSSTALVVVEVKHVKSERQLVGELFDLVTGERVWLTRLDDPGEQFASYTAGECGDVDLDGRSDVVALVRSGDLKFRVVCLSSATGARIWNCDLSCSEARLIATSVSDISGDSIAEVAVVVRNRESHARPVQIKFLNGSSGAELAEWTPVGALGFLKPLGCMRLWRSQESGIIDLALFAVIDPATGSLAMHRLGSLR